MWGGNGGRSRLAASFVSSLPPGLLQDPAAGLLRWQGPVGGGPSGGAGSCRGAAGKKLQWYATVREDEEKVEEQVVVVVEEEVVEGGQRGR